MPKYVQHTLSKKNSKKHISTLLFFLFLILTTSFSTSCGFPNVSTENKSQGKLLYIDYTPSNIGADTIVTKSTEIILSPTRNFNEEGTTFIYEDKEYDVADFAKEIDCISDVEDTAHYLILCGHCPTAHLWNCYVLFHKESKRFKKKYVGDNLIIVNDTIYYTLWNDILDEDDTIVASLDLQEHEWITKIETTKKKKQFQVTIQDERYESEKIRTELVEIL